MFSTNADCLQNQIDSLYQYSLKWGLKINESKTKICIFEKRRSNSHPSFYINGTEVETVDTFCYLGIHFYYTGNITRSIKLQVNKAWQAYFNLLALFRRINIDIKTKLNLFDTMVVPIILYGSNIWGIYTCKEVDKIHIRFCKHILSVNKQTTNYAVLVELGRIPLSIVCKERALNYWIKIMMNPDSLIHEAYSKQSNLLNAKSWASSIRNLLNSLGCTDALQNFNSDFKYSYIFKTRLKDQFIQEWRANLNNMTKLCYYKNYKPNFEYEKYLDILQNSQLLKGYIRFRVGCHMLEIELGRYNNTNRNDRLCKQCNLGQVETEYHFLMICPNYRDLLTDYLKLTSFPTVNKFNNILSSENRCTVLNTAKFIRDAFRIRSNEP